MRRLPVVGLLALALAACGAPQQPETSTPAPSASPSQVTTTEPEPSEQPTPSPTAASPEPEPTGPPVAEFSTTEHGDYTTPWALEFLPGTDMLLITQRTGGIVLRDQTSGQQRDVSGAPDVLAEGQGGMHDFIAAPTFDSDAVVYLSWVRPADSGSQGVVARAVLDVDTATLSDVEEIWVQDPISGSGHFSLRLVIHEDHLFITSGDRRAMDPAQSTATNLGSIIRLTLDGDPAPDNPWAGEGIPADQLWSIGHRNPLGIAVGVDGQLWSSEMGPQGGDELNLIVEGANYGWPEASFGTHYDGTPIPNHTEGDGFEAPKAHWVPAISPGNLMIYQGDLFTGWRGSALMGGLSGQNLVRVELEGDTAEPVAEWNMGTRIRAVEEAPDGSIWIATDDGALLELRPGD